MKAGFWAAVMMAVLLNSGPAWCKKKPAQKPDAKNAATAVRNAELSP